MTKQFKAMLFNTITQINCRKKREGRKIGCKSTPTPSIGFLLQINTYSVHWCEQEILEHQDENIGILKLITKNIKCKIATQPPPLKFTRHNVIKDIVSYTQGDI